MKSGQAFFEASIHICYPNKNLLKMLFQVGIQMNAGLVIKPASGKTVEPGTSLLREISRKD
jgi:hypothetical protein